MRIRTLLTGVTKIQNSKRFGHLDIRILILFRASNFVLRAFHGPLFVDLWALQLRAKSKPLQAAGQLQTAP